MAEKRGALIWLSLSVAIIALDQWTKKLIVDSLREFDEIVVIPGLFEIVRYHNPGAAWSLFADAGDAARWVFTALGVGVSAGIIVWLSRLPARGKHLLAAALCFVVGGALGNVIDRLLHGYVIDFVRVYWWPGQKFPAFNVADSAITIGAALLILENLLEWRRERAQQRAREAS